MDQTPDRVVLTGPTVGLDRCISCGVRAPCIEAHQIGGTVVKICRECLWPSPEDEQDRMIAALARLSGELDEVATRLEGIDGSWEAERFRDLSGKLRRIAAGEDVEPFDGKTSAPSYSTT